MGSKIRHPTRFDVEGVESDFIRLRTKASAQLSYSFVPQHEDGDRLRRPNRLVVYLSGIDSPKTLWKGTVANLLKTSRSQHLALPPMLLYDRFGVGETIDHDPSDAGKTPEERHDVMEAMRDLRQMIIQISEARLGYAEHEIDRLRLVFAAHSIGCCIARLYAQVFPGSVDAMLLIDSALANTLIINLIPNPDKSEDFDEHRLPKGVDAESCRKTIKTLARSMFNPPNSNGERIRWTNLPSLLPFNDAPRLKGSAPGLPLVTVLCHDPEVFLSIAQKVLRVPEVMVSEYLEPGSQRYFDGLVHLQGRGIGKGPVIAKGCGHDVPADNPEFTASELLELLDASLRHFESRI